MGGDSGMKTPEDEKGIRCGVDALLGGGWWVELGVM